MRFLHLVSMLWLSAIVPATNLPPTLERCVKVLENGAGVDEVIVVKSPAAWAPALDVGRGAAVPKRTR